MERTYRNVSYPIVGWLATGVLVVGGLIGAITPHHLSSISRILTALIPAAAALLIYRAYVRSKLIVREDGLTVLNPLHTHDLRWSDVEGFDLVTAILRIRLNSGEVIRVWAVQPAGIRHAMTRGARADAMLAQLADMLERARSAEG